MDATEIINGAGKAIEEKLVAAYKAELLDDYADLGELINLKGESTGYTKVWKGEAGEKISSMSIDIMPDKARYINIQVIPDPKFRLPHYVYEGLVMGHMSQMSVDLYPDTDMVANLDWMLENYQPAGTVFDELRKTMELSISKLTHMRIFSSPMFAMVKTPELEKVMEFEGYAARYADCLFDMQAKAELSAELETHARRERRKLISDSIIALDPDRKMVVGVYGEELTRRIEEATMYSFN